MKKTIVVIFTLIAFLSFGQENKLNLEVNGPHFIEPTELEDIYVKALNSRIVLLLSSGWRYVELNEYGKRISKNRKVADRYKFLTDDELIDLSIRKKKSIRIMRLTHKIISKDTVDINFGIVILKAKRKINFNQGLKFRTANFEVECESMNGYKPDIRFVFDRKQDEWIILSSRFRLTSE